MHNHPQEVGDISILQMPLINGKYFTQEQI